MPRHNFNDLLVGTSLIGTVLRRGFYATLIAIPLLMAVIVLALIAFGHQAGAVIALLALWGLVATAAPVGGWSWITRTFPHHAEVGGGLMVAVVQLSIAIGSTVGGLLFDTLGYQSTLEASAHCRRTDPSDFPLRSGASRLSAHLTSKFLHDHQNVGAYAYGRRLTRILSRT